MTSHDPTDHLTEDDLAALIEAELGGPEAIRDAGLLAAAIARPQATAFGEPAYPTLGEQSAALMHSLVTSHPLVDGNKRVGLAAALLLYGLNGIRLDATDDELFELTMAVADGSLREVGAIADALQRWERPLEPGDRL